MTTPNAPLAPTSSSVETASSSRSILVIDDEATIRSALRRFFARRGWRVDEAHDGEHAREILLAGQTVGGGYDAIVTDMRMPRLSGVQLHALVAAADTTLARRFIFSSGDTGVDGEAATYLQEAGCPVVPKPFELSELLRLAEGVAAAAENPPLH
jgi:DNA-binding response OmpR family regulator